VLPPAMQYEYMSRRARREALSQCLGRLTRTPRERKHHMTEPGARRAFRLTVAARAHAMDDALLDAIVHPHASNAQRFLEHLGLDAAPSREQVHREIEARLLLPKEKLPDDWLPRYQACVGAARSPFPRRTPEV
jgi:hypothetical protein